MPDHKKKTANHNLNMKTAYLIFIVLLLMIIIFATLLLFSRKNNDDTVKGESVINTETVTTALSSDVAETVTKTIFTNTTELPVLSSVISSHTVTETTAVSSVQTTAPKNNISQNVTVPPATSPIIYNYSDNVPAHTSANTVDSQVNITTVSNTESYTNVTATVENVVVPSEPEITVPEESTTAPQADEPTYIDGILIANKTYALPEDYNPGLDSETESAFYTLSNAAAEEGLNIYLSSGFRSYETQNRIYNNYVSNYGQASADTFSARPGHSEHQTGLAIDVNSIDDSFAGTPEAEWLACHAHEYGFIIRYPKGKENITGYKYEPWHIRYLGVEKANEVYNSGLTLEEFLGIDSEYKD